MIQLTVAHLPPVIDQTIYRVPLDFWSALGFGLIVVLAGVLGYIRSGWALGLLAFGVPFAAYRDIGDTTVTFEKCLALGVAAGLLVSGAPVIPSGRAARSIFYAGIGLMLAIALSATGAKHLAPVAREFLKQAEYVLLFWCAATMLQQHPNSTVIFCRGLLASVLIVSTSAVLQGVFGGAPSGMWINGHPVPRVAGPLEGPNQLAGYLEAALPLLWVTPLLLGSSSFPWRYVNTASVAALILTQSRAGILMAALAFGAFYKLRAVLARLSLLPILVGISAAIVITVGWFGLFAHAKPSEIATMLDFSIPQNAGGVGTRGQLWQAAITLFRSHPVVGVGAGNYELLLPSIGLQGVKTQAASLWLQTLAEQGLVGLIALAIFAYVALRRTFELRAVSPLALAACIALASLLVHQFVDDLFFFPKVAGLVWLLLGAGAVVRSKVELPPTDSYRQMPAVIPREVKVAERI